MLQYLTSGESHGQQLTSIIEGMPAGLKINLDQIDYHLSRRQKGYGRGGRMDIEEDKVEVVSGIRNGITLGSPITLVIKNKDWINWEKIMHPFHPVSEDLTDKERKLAFYNTTPRPGHADLPGAIKFNQKDLRNILERASARETAIRVATGCIARQFLESFKIKIASHVRSIGSVSLPDDFKYTDLDNLIELTEASEVRCADVNTAEKMISEITKAKENQDSLGGVVEIIVNGLPVGLGGFSQPEKRLDSLLGAAFMAIPSVKGFEIGLGFKSAKISGSSVHDEIYYRADSNPIKKNFFRKTNNAGGLEGGMTNGEDLVVRVAAKPISTLNRPLKSVDIATKEATSALVERTDNCIVPVLGVVCEAVAALVLADSFMEKFGSDNMSEIKSNYNSYLKNSF